MYEVEKIVTPTKTYVFNEATNTFKCKKCGNLFGPLDLTKTFREQRCIYCDADIAGKVYPKKRLEPRQEKRYNLIDCEDDIILAKILDDNPDKLHALDSLIGVAKKLVKINGGEIKARFKKILEERDK